MHPTDGMVPREVSICHLGARDKTLIANLELSAEEYKSSTQRAVHNATAAIAAMTTQEKMDTKADAASTGVPAEPTPPVAEVSPEEQCVLSQHAVFAGKVFFSHYFCACL